MNSLETCSGQRFHLVRLLSVPTFTPCAPTPKEERWCPSRYRISANKFSDHGNLRPPSRLPPQLTLIASPTPIPIQVRRHTILDSEDPLCEPQEDYGNDHPGVDDPYPEGSGTISRLHNPPRHRDGHEYICRIQPQNRDYSTSPVSLMTTLLESSSVSPSTTHVHHRRIPIAHPHIRMVQS